MTPHGSPWGGRPATHEADGRGLGVFHRARHRRRPGQQTVAETKWRIFRETWFVRPIRQVVAREGEVPYLEVIDVYGRHTYLGRMWR